MPSALSSSSPSPSGPASTEQVADDQVQAVRAFNRFYTQKLGVLDQQLLKSPFSLSEARVLYELAHGGEQSAKEIGIALGLDAGYLSRIVQNFDESGLIARKPLPSDRRQVQLSLTAKGRQAFARLERSSQDDVAAMLRPLPDEERSKLTGAMETIERLLAMPRTPSPRATLREPRPGDMGWVVQSHGALYASEYGFDSGFEALVAEIVAKYMTSYDASRERCCGGHGVLHLHRLDDDQRRALVHVRPGLHQDPDHSALQGRHHLVHWAVNLPSLGQAARTA